MYTLNTIDLLEKIDNTMEVARLLQAISKDIQSDIEHNKFYGIDLHKLTMRQRNALQNNISDRLNHAIELL